MNPEGPWPVPLAIPLEGGLVALEPLEPAHADELWAAAQAPEIWRWLAHLDSSRGYFDRWFELSLSAHRDGREGVFATRDRRRGGLVGSTRYLAVRSADRPDVGLRDSAYFSVIDSEWPAVRANLERRLAR